MKKTTRIQYHAGPAQSASAAMDLQQICGNIDLNLNWNDFSPEGRDEKCGNDLEKQDVECAY